MLLNREVVIITILLTIISVNFVESVQNQQKEETTNFTNDNNNRNVSLLIGRSFNEIAKEKLANLQHLRDQLVKRKRLNNERYKKSKFKDNKPENTTNMTSAVILLHNKHRKDEVLQIALNAARQNQIWSQVFPSPDILKRLARMREKLEPKLRKYLTKKYNDLLMNLVEYNNSIGVPSYVIRSMVIPQTSDARWNFIEQLLETSSLEGFLANLPDLASLAKQKISSFSPFLGFKHSGNGIVQGRSDDDFISDQEPQATSKGRKKYSGLRLSNRAKYRKGSSSEYEPHRSGYEYATAGDNYGLYSHSSYDSSYGKGYDDYYSAKPLNDKGYNDYSGKTKSVKGIIGKYTGLRLGSGSFDNYAAAGQNSYSYGHGGGGGYGGGGSGLTDYLDPFSILGGLAFLVYLGLLFQQSLNATGRALPGSSVFDTFGTSWKKPVVLTQLSFSKEFETPSLGRLSRHGRSVKTVEDFDSEAVESLEDFWNEIENLNQMPNSYCQQQEACHIIRDLYCSGLLNIFQDELKKYVTDKKFLHQIFKRLEIEGVHLTCELKSQCAFQRNLQDFHPYFQAERFYNDHWA